MDILLYLALWTVPLLVGYFVIRLAVRHGVMDAHGRLHPARPADQTTRRPDHLRHMGKLVQSGSRQRMVPPSRSSASPVITGSVGQRQLAQAGQFVVTLRWRRNGAVVQLLAAGESHAMPNCQMQVSGRSRARAVWQPPSETGLHGILSTT